MNTRDWQQAIWAKCLEIYRDMQENEWDEDEEEMLYASQFDVCFTLFLGAFGWSMPSHIQFANAAEFTTTDRQEWFERLNSLMIVVLGEGDNGL